MLRQLSGDTADSLAREIEEALKRPHIDLLLRPGQQARLEPARLRVARSGVRRRDWPPARSSKSCGCGRRTPDGRRRTSSTSSIAPAERLPATLEQRFRESPARRAQIVPMVREWATQRRAIVAFPAVVDGRQKYVQVQLRFSGPNRERVTRLPRVHGRRRASADDVFPGADSEAPGHRAAADRVPAARAVPGSTATASRSPSAASRRRRSSSSTSAPSRSCSSITSCSNTPRRTSSAARRGGSAPATARRRFRRSSAPARGRSWR